MRPELGHLSSLLKLHMPALFGFVVLRIMIGSAAGAVCKTITPKSITMVVRKIFTSIRSFVLLVGVAWMFTSMELNPSVVCKPCYAARVQGIASAVSIVSLASSSNIFCSCLALVTLVAVRDLSPISILDAAALAVTLITHDVRKTSTWIVVFHVTCAVIAVAHAAKCSDSISIHSSVLLAILVTLYYSICLMCRITSAIMKRIWRSVKKIVGRAH
tara:strand:+ start:129 stop:776 length:648 start_codon:yes stop_codon:yes gene_type:complete